jgi:hypothetical protein
MHVESVSPVTHVKKGGKDQMAGYVNPLDEGYGRKGLFETVPFDALLFVGWFVTDLLDADSIVRSITGD